MFCVPDYTFISAVNGHSCNFFYIKAVNFWSGTGLVVSSVSYKIILAMRRTAVLASLAFNHRMLRDEWWGFLVFIVYMFNHAGNILYTYHVIFALNHLCEGDVWRCMSLMLRIPVENHKAGSLSSLCWATRLPHFHPSLRPLKSYLSSPFVRCPLEYTGWEVRCWWGKYIIKNA